MTIDRTVALRERNCSWCGALFCICSRCDRGHRYCNPRCRLLARREQRRLANRRYQQSPEGKEDHRDRQREYRLRNNHRVRVTDQGSLPAIAKGTMAAWNSIAGSHAAKAGSTAVSPRSSVPVMLDRSLETIFPRFSFCAWCGYRGRVVDVWS